MAARPEPEPADTRTRLLDATESLVARHGYEGTGVNAVLAESGVGNGSLYHHFPGGKDELVAASIERTGSVSRDQIAGALDRGSAVGVAAMFDVTAARLVRDEFEAGCRIATPLADVAPSADGVRVAAVAAFDSWAAAIADRLVHEGWDRDRARATGSTVVALLQGSLLLARAERTCTPMTDAREAALDLLRARASTAEPERRGRRRT
jgi:TetR/AcrR family transcriptional repressor of lmrAB and yxaGH operons